VEGEDFSLPRPDGTGKARQLRHPDAVRPAVEAPQRGPGVGQVAGGVDSAQQLLALPGDRHLTTRVTGGQPSPQPHPSPAGELLCGGQQQLADAVQRIAFASPVPEVACWVRRRTWSTTKLASRMAWKWSTTTVAWPSGTTSALA
jgi:hypothetical protein